VFFKETTVSKSLVDGSREFFDPALQRSRQAGGIVIHSKPPNVEAAAGWRAKLNRVKDFSLKKVSHE
jgi:hypothetical protein